MSLFHTKQGDLYEKQLLSLLASLESSLNKHSDIDFSDANKALQNPKASNMVKGAALLWLDKDIQAAVHDYGLI